MEAGGYEAESGRESEFKEDLGMREGGRAGKGGRTRSEAKEKEDGRGKIRG